MVEERYVNCIISDTYVEQTQSLAKTLVRHSEQMVGLTTESKYYCTAYIMRKETLTEGQLYPGF